MGWVHDGDMIVSEERPLPVYKYLYQCSNCGKQYLKDNNNIKLYDCTHCKTRLSVWETRFIRVR